MLSMVRLHATKHSFSSGFIAQISKVAAQGVHTSGPNLSAAVAASSRH